MKKKNICYILTYLFMGILFLLPFLIFNSCIDFIRVPIDFKILHCCTPIIMLIIGIVMNSFMSKMLRPLKVRIRDKYQFPPKFSCLLMWSKMDTPVRNYGSALVFQIKMVRSILGGCLVEIVVILIFRKASLSIEEILGVCMLLVLFVLLSGQAYLNLLNKYYEKTHKICVCYECIR